MLTRADAIALLKVLIAASWADGRLTQAEMNYIKPLAQRFQLAEADWLQLEPYLEDPPSEREVDGMFRDLLNRLATPGARNEVIPERSSRASGQQSLKRRARKRKRRFRTVILLVESSFKNNAISIELKFAQLALRRG